MVFISKERTVSGIMLKESLLVWIDRPASNSDLDMINMLVKKVQNWNDLKIKLEDIAKIEYAVVISNKLID